MRQSSRGIIWWVRGFFEAHRVQLMTRLLALLCVLEAGVVVWRAPLAWQTISALIAGGAVALVTRSKDGKALEESAPTGTSNEEG